jgi:hypothetical protein
MEIIYPSNNSPKPDNSEEKLHYENLASFLKWAVTVALSLLAIIGGFGLFFFYKDSKSIKDEFTAKSKELSGQLAEIKNEAKETEKSIKTDLRYEVKATKDYTDNELQIIRSETNRIALQETQKQVESIFASNKIQHIIEDQAISQVKEKVESMVNNATKNIIGINDAASKMRIGLPEGMYKLKSYFKSPTNNKGDSLKAKNIYDLICSDYYEAEKADTFSTGYGYYYTEDSKYANTYLPIHIVNNKMPTDPKEIKVLNDIINFINNKHKRYDLNIISIQIGMLSKLTNIDFRPFQIDEINKWYSELLEK